LDANSTAKSATKSNLPKPTPVSRAKAFADKLFNKKGASSASTATTRAPGHVMNDEAFSPSNTSRTPQHIAAKPDKAEMHPQLNNRRAQPEDEAPWLGFFNMQPRTDPARPKDVELPKILPPSPSPMRITQPVVVEDVTSKAEFDYKFTNSSLKLSPKTMKLMENTRAEAAALRAKMVAERDEIAEQNSARKMLVPKGKSGRFSDVHKDGFKKMDSIASHHSLQRIASKNNLADSADTGYVRPTSATKVSLSKPSQSLKRTPSRAELSRPSTGTLKRSPSKAELDKITPSALKRSPSKAELDKPLPPTLRRPPSKGDLTKLRSPDKKVVAPAVSMPHTSNQTDAERSAKRARLAPSETLSPSPRPALIISPSPKARSMIGRAPRLGLFNPTRSSLARAKSVRASATKIPGVVFSNSATDNMFGASIPTEVDSPLQERARSLAPSPMSTRLPSSARALNPSPVRNEVDIAGSPIRLHGHLSNGSTNLLARSRIPAVSPIKSILRSPHILYSNNPAKIAAGTHFATPPDARTSIIPATAPVKRVEFTTSVKEKAARDEAKALSLSPNPKPLYPDLSQYLADKNITAMHTASSVPPKHSNRDEDFSFRVGVPKNFTSESPTIRKVRRSDVQIALLPPNQASASASPKRKVDEMLSDPIDDGNKENIGNVYERPIKRIRTKDSDNKPIVNKIAKVLPKKAVSTKKSTLPGPRSRGGSHAPDKRAGGLTAERLAFLSQPKRRG
jgi:hypothetical protein